MVAVMEQMPKINQIENTKGGAQMVYRLWYYQRPDGSCCFWAITASDDGDYSFGYCDLGMGFPEWGYVMQSELKSVGAKVLDIPEGVEFSILEPHLTDFNIENIRNVVNPA